MTSPARPGMSWSLDGMTIVVKDQGEPVLRIGICEVLDSTPRVLVERHLKVIERTPWLAAWHPQLTKHLPGGPDA